MEGACLKIMVVWGPNSSALELWWSNYTAWKTISGVPLKIDLLETYWKPPFLVAIFGGQTVVLVFEGGSTANFLAESGRFSKSKKGDSRASILAAHSGVQICWVAVSNIFYFHPYLGKIPILTHIFQMGWNHQLDFIWWVVLNDVCFKKAMRSCF